MNYLYLEKNWMFQMRKLEIMCLAKKLTVCWIISDQLELELIFVQGDVWYNLCLFLNVVRKLVWLNTWCQKFVFIRLQIWYLKNAINYIVTTWFIFLYHMNIMFSHHECLLRRLLYNLPLKKISRSL